VPYDLRLRSRRFSLLPGSSRSDGPRCAPAAPWLTFKRQAERSIISLIGASKPERIARAPSLPALDAQISLMPPHGSGQCPDRQSYGCDVRGFSALVDPNHIPPMQLDGPQAPF
jgi:hypothetical protein